MQIQEFVFKITLMSLKLMIIFKYKIALCPIHFPHDEMYVNTLNPGDMCVGEMGHYRFR